MSADSDLIDFYINERVNSTRNNAALFMSILVSLVIIYFAFYSYIEYTNKKTFIVLISFLLIVVLANLILSCLSYGYQIKSGVDEEKNARIAQSASYLNAIQIISIIALSLFIFCTKFRMKRCYSTYNHKLNQVDYFPSCIFIAMNLIAIPYIILRILGFKNDSDFTHEIRIPPIFPRE